VIGHSAPDGAPSSRFPLPDQLEHFFATKFPSAKRFGIEGCESLMAGLFALAEVRTSVLNADLCPQDEEARSSRLRLKGEPLAGKGTA
jgi:hypothetical protein